MEGHHSAARQRVVEERPSHVGRAEKSVPQTADIIRKAAPVLPPVAGCNGGETMKTIQDQPLMFQRDMGSPK